MRLSLACGLVVASLTAATVARAGAPPPSPSADDDGLPSFHLTNDPGWRFAIDAIATAHDLPGENDDGYGGPGLQLDAVWQTTAPWLGLVSRVSVDRSHWVGENQLRPPYTAPTFTVWNAQAVEGLRACAVGVLCLEVGLGVGVAHGHSLDGFPAFTDTAPVEESRLVLELPFTHRIGGEAMAGIAHGPDRTELMVGVGVMFR